MAHRGPPREGLGPCGVAHQPLADELGLAVGRLGALRGVLRDELDIGSAEDGGRAREDDIANTRGQTLLEQDARALDVDAIELKRLAHGDACVLQPSDVDNTLEPMRAQRRRDRVCIGDRRDDERDSIGYELGPPAREVIEHHRIEALRRERPHHMRTDVTRTTSHQPRHTLTLDAPPVFPMNVP